MFDIGWSEFLVIAVVALIAIGPKELPGVLRMVGQWMGKARKMAAEFQGQFQEAMREAEMADLKKSFDEVREAASGFTSGNLMTSLEKDVSSALRAAPCPIWWRQLVLSATMMASGRLRIAGSRFNSPSCDCTGALCGSGTIRRAESSVPCTAPNAASYIRHRPGRAS